MKKKIFNLITRLIFILFIIGLNGCSTLPAKAITTTIPMAVVATTCPSVFGSPCFDDSNQSIQQAIDYMTTQYPGAERTVLITPGIYQQVFSTHHPQNGTIHLVGAVGSPSTDGGPIQILPPNPLPVGVDGAWVFEGPGTVSNLFFGSSSETNFKGIVIKGIVLLELYFENVHMFGILGPAGKGLVIIPTMGFITINDSSFALNADNGDADTALVYIDRTQVPFTEFAFRGGYYMLWGENNPVGSSTFEIHNSPYGDDGHGMVVEDIHLQCEGDATCFETDDDKVNLEIGPLVFRRSPSGQFFHIKQMDAEEDGIPSNNIFFHGVVREEGTIASEWLNVVPKGTMTIIGNGVPTMPAFPGWTYKRLDGGPGESTYIGEGTGSPPYTWKQVITEP